MTPASPPRALIAYVRERFPLQRYVPLSLLLAAAGIVGASPIAPKPLARGALIALALMFQLRLWDDLADRHRDQIEHPERVLSRAGGVAPFQALLAVSAAINAALLAWLAPHRGYAAVFLGLIGFYVLWYNALRDAVRSPLAASLVVLAKYPVMVYLAGEPHLSPGGALQRAIAMALVYLCFCVYEVLHDPRLRSEPRVLSVLGVEMAGMITAFALMREAIARRSVVAALAHPALLLVSAIALSVLFLRYRQRGALPFWSQGVFFLCFLQILSFTSCGPA